MRGATKLKDAASNILGGFLPTLPMRGATVPISSSLLFTIYFYPRSP